MGLRQFVIDAWSWLNYKPVMAEAGRPGNQSFPELTAVWLPPQELRRLAAYKVLSAYDNNQAGQLAAAAGDETGIERRELGDAAKLVDTALGYLLGSEQKIAVEGAEHAEGEAPKPGATEAAALQEQLRTWADKELLTLRIQQAERAAVLLGDSVYVLAKIRDRRHRLHRSYVGPDGTRQMDTRVDEVLRIAGLEDVARYRATTPCGSATAVSRTVDGCSTHGPDARIDRIYVTTDLLAAVTNVDVIEVPLHVSDHHIVRLTLDGDRLSDILNRQLVQVAIPGEEKRL